jgi:signal transduction histidine kinase
MMEPYLKLEDQQALHNIERILLVVQGELSNLNTTARDFSVQNETYNFIKSRNVDYISNSLADSFFVSQRLNFVIFFDRLRKVVFARAFDLNSSQPTIFPISLLFSLARNNLLLTHDSPKSSVIGILNGPNIPALVASSPIVANNQGPIYGTLIIGRYLDGHETECLQAIAGVPVTAIWGSEAVNSKTLQDGSTQVNVEANSITASTMLTDVNGQPSVILETSINRNISIQGALTIQHFLWITLFEGAIFAALTIVVLQEQVFKRLNRLSVNLNEIGNIGNVLKRLPIDHHNDELTSLTDNTNRMLQEIETSNARLTQNERLAAIGELALMVGHDLRNPLQSIIVAHSVLMNQLTPKDETSKPMLDIIKESVEYADKIVKNLSEYSKEPKVNLTQTTINSIINNAITTLQVPNTVLVKLPENDYSLTADARAMQEVFTNLIRNAIDAMPNGGILTMTTSKRNGDLSIDVSDTGIGIPKQVMENLGKPLQTTKAKGLGLGLAISKRIVEAHAGTLAAETIHGKGSTFTVTLRANNGEGGNTGA